MTAFKRGYHGDLNETYYVGEVAESSKQLVKTTYEAIWEAINICKPGVAFKEIGNVISSYVEPKGYSVVRSYCGHGVGKLFHTSPTIPHYARNKCKGIMTPGNVFTIEPMINIGTHKDTIWNDDWTVVTTDGKLSA